MRALSASIAALLGHNVCEHIFDFVIDQMQIDDEVAT